MKDRRYSQNSPLLGIPVLGYGDRISPEIEMVRAKIIENMLIAGTNGIKNCIFQEGYFRLVENYDDDYTVTLSSSGSSFSIEGMIDGAYVRGGSQIKWEGLKGGRTYWLYLNADTKTFEDFSRIHTTISRYRLEKGLLVAKVSLHDIDGGCVIDKNPSGKIYSSDISRHSLDNVNPHGQKLHQDSLSVSNRLSLSEDTLVEVIDSNGISRQVDIFSPKVEILGFNSFGREGGVLSAKKPVSHVCIQRVDLDGVLGDVAVGYFGEDERIDQDSEFFVCNGGEENVKLRAIVYYK